MSLSKDDLDALIHGKKPKPRQVGKEGESVAVVGVRSDGLALVTSAAGPLFSDLLKFPMGAVELGLILPEGLTDRAGLWLVFDIDRIDVSSGKTTKYLYAGSWHRIRKMRNAKEFLQ